MTSADLHDLVLATLVRQAGGTRRRWRLVVGAVKVYPVATHPHCNWAITPSGSASETDAVERVADELRGRHAIVTPD